MRQTNRRSLPTEHFDELYRKQEDPWRTLYSPYEAEKSSDTLSLLSQIGHIDTALELGCGVGSLTRLLALRCDNVIATDCSDEALGQARRNCVDLCNITFAPLRIPDQLDGPPVDLIVLSEAGYYLSPSDLVRTKWKIIERLVCGGYLLLTHWLGDSRDHVSTGKEVHDAFLRGASSLHPMVGKEVTLYGCTYRTDVLRKCEQT